MPTDDSMKSMAAQVPEVYFDIISRIPPGMLVLIIMARIFDDSFMVFLDKMNDLNWAIGGLCAIMLFGSAYVVGLLITQIGAMVSLIHCHFIDKSSLKENRDIIMKFCDQEDLTKPDDDKFSFYQFYNAMREFLRIEHPESKPILAKMHAEYALCHNLMAAVLLSVFGLILKYIVLGVFEDKWVMILLLLLFILSVNAARHRYRRALDRHLICLKQILP